MSDETTDDDKPTTDGPAYNLGRPHSFEDVGKAVEAFDQVGEGVKAFDQVDQMARVYESSAKANEQFHKNVASMAAAASRIKIPEFPKLPDFSTEPLVTQPFIPRDYMAEVAAHTEQMAEWTAGLEEMQEENERKEAERDAREERAIKIAIWSFVVAVLALVAGIAAIAVPLIVG